MTAAPLHSSQLAGTTALRMVVEAAYGTIIPTGNAGAVDMPVRAVVLRMLIAALRSGAPGPPLTELPQPVRRQTSTCVRITIHSTRSRLDLLPVASWLRSRPLGLAARWGSKDPRFTWARGSVRGSIAASAVT